MNSFLPFRAGVGALLAAGWTQAALSAATPIVSVPELQPLAAQIRRVVDALNEVGSPLSPADQAALTAALAESNPALAGPKIQSILDQRVLFSVNINPEMRVKVAPGDAAPKLVEAGWKTFLVKVHNEAGTTAQLRVTSPEAGRLHGSPAGEVGDRWLMAELFNGHPLAKELGGLTLEYRLIQLYSRDAGRREAKFTFNVGQGTQDLGFRAESNLLFTVDPAREVSLHVRDEAGKPTTGALWVTDRQGHVYPAQAKRLAPDFFFHPQVYRADGETLRLPEGQYTVTFQRGPESIPETRQLTVDARGGDWSFQVVRWIDPSTRGWW